MKTTDPTMSKDLARSGLTATHAKKMHLSELTQVQAAELGVPNLRSYLIPYFDLDGNVLPNYWRVRYLQQRALPFGASPRRPLRYIGTKDAVPKFYLPPLLKKPWKEIAADPTESLVITEGEKKAAKACAEGMPCISIPGVWAWRSKKRGLLSVPDFDAFAWEKRNVYLCFDNDLHDNPNVKAALGALGRELTFRGAFVAIKYLPRDPAKMGLDDYLLTHSTADWFALPAEQFMLAAKLWHLNEDVIYIRKLGMMYSNVLGAVMSREQFINGEYSDRFHLEQRTDAEGNTTYKKVRTAKTWMEWPLRSKVQNICYRPGEAGITADNALNLWQGLGVEPVQGDIRPFEELLEYLVPEAQYREWFLQWLAYPLQHPGTKLYTAVMMQSTWQGNGKSFLGYIMGDVYGSSNFSKVGARQLHSDFNTWCANKQFILGEEITGTEKRSEADNLKSLITQETLLVNNKFEKEYVLEDCANYYLTSNHVDALFLEMADRRLFVQSVLEPPLPHEFYIETLDGWRRQGGAKHLLYHLLFNIDCTSFSPRAAAPTTIHKEAMIHFSKSDTDLFCERLMNEPESILQDGATSSFQLMTATEILHYCDARYVTAASLGKALQRNNLRHQRVRCGEAVLTLYPVRNSRYWYKEAAQGNLRTWASHRLGQVKTTSKFTDSADEDIPF